MLKRFNKPHKRIHAIAEDVGKYVVDENFSAAFSIIQKTRDNELAEMIKLFAEVRKLLRESTREIALVLEWKDLDMVISVDSVETVEKLDKKNIEKVSDVVNTVNNEFICGIGKSEKEDKMVQLIDVEKIIQKESNLPLTP